MVVMMNVLVYARENCLRFHASLRPCAVNPNGRRSLAFMAKLSFEASSSS